MRVVDLIARKRDGQALTGDEVVGLIAAYMRDEADDAQMAAWLMAGLLNGFDDAETAALTHALAASGRSIDLSTLAGPTVDKHSTGGVGDTTTLVVAPVLAAAGCQVAKLSGRSLGHTGGTIDKLASVPGLEVELTAERLVRQVEEIGLAVAAAGPDLAPADRRLYALRDVTATVEDPALIASSVMSKKLAGGARHVLLDVKVGAGAFVADLPAARALARRCRAVGEAHGRRTAALLTDMAEPLSDAVGNALEVAAAVEVLRGAGGRLRECSLALAAAALCLTGIEEEEARRQARRVLDNGDALGKLREFIRAQGGPPELTERPWEVLPSAPVVRDWMAPPGTVAAVDARGVGRVAHALGAGRDRAGDAVDPAVGLQVWVRRGDRVDATVPAVRIHARDEAGARAAAEALASVVTVGPEPVEPLPLVLGTEGLAGSADGEGRDAGAG